MTAHIICPCERCVHTRAKRNKRRRAHYVKSGNQRSTRARLSEDEVRNLRKGVLSCLSLRDAARQLGVSSTTAGLAKRGHIQVGHMRTDYATPVAGGSWEHRGGDCKHHGDNVPFARPYKSDDRMLCVQCMLAAALVLKLNAQVQP